MNRTLVVLALLAPAAAASAATTVYTDETTFLAQLQTFYLNDFSDYTYGSPLDGSTTSQSYGATNGFSYVAEASNGLWSNDSSLSLNFPNDTLTLTFTGSPTAVYAVGGIISATDISGGVIDQGITATTSDATSAVLTGSGFVGFISDTPITWVTFAGDQANTQNWAQIDHLYAATAVPEPATIAAFLGASALLMVRKRRQAAA